MEAASPSSSAGTADVEHAERQAREIALQSVTPTAGTAGMGPGADADADADAGAGGIKHGAEDADSGAGAGTREDAGPEEIEDTTAPLEHHASPESETVPPASIRTAPPPPRLVTAPRFARRTLSMVDTGPRWPGVAVILALILLLSLQLLLSQRAQLAGQPQWRPTLEGVCGALGCSLPAWREPEAFAMVTRSVRPSPVHPGVLEITATFRNDAAREQAWPVLLLSLSDIHGQTVGARAFAPAEYRDQRTTGNTLAPGQTVTVLLDVVEPAPDTVAFSFDFR